MNERERLAALAVVLPVDDDHRKIGHRDCEAAHLLEIDAPMRPADDEHEHIAFFQSPSPVVERPALPGRAFLAFAIDLEKFTDRAADFLGIVAQAGRERKACRRALSSWNISSASSRRS